jgi:hypothetical protein
MSFGRMYVINTAHIAHTHARREAHMNLPKPKKSSSNVPLAFALTFFASLTFAFPLYVSHNPSNPLSTSEKSLSSAAIRRGVFMNSGSKDVGYDPTTDVDTMHSKKKKK